MDDHGRLIEKLWTEGCVEFSRGFFNLRPTVLRRVAFFSKGIIAEENPAEQSYSNGLNEVDKTHRMLVYYPAVADSSLLARSASLLRGNSPGKFFPGSAGVLHYFDSSNLGIPVYVVDEVQSCFKRGFPKELNRSKATEHLAYRPHLFDHLFQKATAENIQEVRFGLFKKYGAGTVESMKIFRRCAENNGFKVTVTRNSQNRRVFVAKRK